MANQVQVTVYQIDGGPLSSPITVSFLTSDILCYETTIGNIAAVQAAVVYYPNSSNPLQIQTFYVSESVDDILSAANGGITTQIQGTVYQIDKSPFRVPIKYNFPANQPSIWNYVDGDINAYVEYKNKKYYVSETEAYLLNIANSGGGGSTNSGNLYIPYNNNNSFADSYFLNDAPNKILKSVYGGNDVGLKLDFVNFQTILGDPDGLYTGTNFVVDYNTAVIKSNFQGNDIGLKLDFANSLFSLGQSNNYSSTIGFISDTFNGKYAFGDLAGSQNELFLEINAANSYIKTQYQGNDIGLKLDFANEAYYFGGVDSGVLVWQINWLYRFGDYGYNNNGTYLEINDQSQIIQTINQGGALGLKLDFNNEVYELGGFSSHLGGVKVDLINGEYILGNYSASGQITQLNVNDVSQIIKTKNNGNDIGLKLDFANNQYTLGDYLNEAIRIETENIYTRYGNNSIGLKLDFSGTSYYFGDFNSINSGTYLQIDDLNQKWIMSSNLLSNSAGSNSSQHLVVWIGGNQYKIQLKNP